MNVTLSLFIVRTLTRHLSSANVRTRRSREWAAPPNLFQTDLVHDAFAVYIMRHFQCCSSRSIPIRYWWPCCLCTLQAQRKTVPWHWVCLGCSFVFGSLSDVFMNIFRFTCAIRPHFKFRCRQQSDASFVFTPPTFTAVICVLIESDCQFAGWRIPQAIITVRCACDWSEARVLNVGSAVCVYVTAFVCHHWHELLRRRIWLECDCFGVPHIISIQNIERGWIRAWQRRPQFANFLCDSRCCFWLIIIATRCEA